MKTTNWFRFILVMAFAVTAFTGCGGGSNDDGDDGDGVILFKGQKDNLRVGIEESIVNIPNPGTGTMTVLVSWGDSRRIRAYFTISGPGTHLGDITSAMSPFETSINTVEGINYILYLGNPDGPDVVDVDYTVSFTPQSP